MLHSSFACRGGETENESTGGEGGAGIRQFRAGGLRESERCVCVTGGVRRRSQSPLSRRRPPKTNHQTPFRLAGG